MDRVRPWGIGSHDIHRVFQKGKTVARVDANAHILAVYALEHFQHMKNEPVFVVLDRQRDSILFDDGRDRLDIVPRAFGKLVELRAVIELLVAPAAAKAADGRGARGLDAANARLKALQVHLASEPY